VPNPTARADRPNHGFFGTLTHFKGYRAGTKNQSTASKINKKVFWSVFRPFLESPKNNAEKVTKKRAFYLKNRYNI